MRSVFLRSLCGAVACLAVAPHLQAQTLYQCLSAQGQPEFSGQPCSSRTRPPASPAPVRDSPVCQNARQAVESASEPGSTDYRNVQARLTAMYSACGLQKPQVTIIHDKPQP